MSDGFTTFSSSTRGREPMSTLLKRMASDKLKVYTFSTRTSKVGVTNVPSPLFPSTKDAEPSVVSIPIRGKANDLMSFSWVFNCIMTSFHGKSVLRYQECPITILATHYKPVATHVNTKTLYAFVFCAINLVIFIHSVCVHWLARVLGLLFPEQGMLNAGSVLFPSKPWSGLRGR